MLCDRILQELDRALRRPYFAARVTQAERDAVGAVLRAAADMRPDPVEPQQVLRDPDDDYLARPLRQSLDRLLQLGAQEPPGTAPDLWAHFDSVVGQFGSAMQSGEAGVIRRSLEELSVTLHDIAESLDRYRGRYGNWRELPPDEVDENTGDGSADTPEATE